MALFFKLLILILSSFPFFSSSLSTLSISETLKQTLVCGLNKQSLTCTNSSFSFSSHNFSLSEIVSGDGFLCGLHTPFSSSTSALVCWRFSYNPDNLIRGRIFLGEISQLSAGNSHICGLIGAAKRLQCWQWWEWVEFNSTTWNLKFLSIAVGENFVCALLESGKAYCFGNDSSVVGSEPSGNFSSISAGFRHVCAVNLEKHVKCWGQMMGEEPEGEFASLALGEDRSCGLRPNGYVVCWGRNNFCLPEQYRETYFMSIQAKREVFCGILMANFSAVCWGNPIFDSNRMVLDNIMPGRCVTACPCGVVPGYSQFCSQGYICSTCEVKAVVPSSPPPSAPQPQPPGGGGGSSKRRVAFMVVGAIGTFSLGVILCFLIYLYCKSRVCRVYDSGRLDEQGNEEAQEHQSPLPLPLPLPLPRPPLPPVLEKRLSQLASIGNGNQLEEFSLQVLSQATDNFSEKHKIGTGSFGSVYHGTLDDEREVAIKRAEISTSSTYPGASKWHEDKDNAFVSELEFLSRLNHKNLVRLIGYCEDCNELALVYEYMNNGSLHDHLHKLQNSALISWSKRLAVALDAARGIEYLHVYAVPPVIHRDIKSSNILLDTNWTAKVSDFGLSLMGPEGEKSHISLHAAGTVGYMDPEYYKLQQLTTKSDIYSFGVVLLELLSGCKAIHLNPKGMPRNVVDFVAPYIVQDEIHRVLDRNVPPPTPFEIEAVAYIGYLAVDCVSLDSQDRPSMTEIVNTLERALDACLSQPMLSRSTTESSIMLEPETEF